MAFRNFEEKGKRKSLVLVTSASRPPQAYLLLIPTCLEPLCLELTSSSSTQTTPSKPHLPTVIHRNGWKYQLKLGHTRLAQDLIWLMGRTNHIQTKQGLKCLKDPWYDRSDSTMTELYPATNPTWAGWSGWTWIWQLKHGLVSNQPESVPDLVLTWSKSDLLIDTMSTPPDPTWISSTLTRVELSWAKAA